MAVILRRRTDVSLQKAGVVMNREKALKMLWRDRCTVMVRQRQTDPITKLTDFVETVVLENQPCKLSFETLAATSDGNVAAATQSVKLFLDKDVDIPAGSKIIVTRGKRTFTYAKSGEPGVFTYHQEIQLEKWKRWA